MDPRQWPLYSRPGGSGPSSDGVMAELVGFGLVVLLVLLALGWLAWRRTVGRRSGPDRLR